MTTLTGTAGTAGSVDGVGAAAQFAYPWDIAVDATGNVIVSVVDNGAQKVRKIAASGGVYVVDRGNNTIRHVARDGAVTTIVGKGGASGIVLGALPGGVDRPNGLAIDGNGVLHTASEKAILRIKVPSP